MRLIIIGTVDTATSVVKADIRIIEKVRNHYKK